MFALSFALWFDHFIRHDTSKCARPGLGRKDALNLTLPCAAPLCNLGHGEQICMHTNAYTFQEVVYGKRCCIMLTYLAWFLSKKKFITNQFACLCIFSGCLCLPFCIACMHAIIFGAFTQVYSWMIRYLCSWGSLSWSVASSVIHEVLKCSAGFCDTWHWTSGLRVTESHSDRLLQDCHLLSAMHYHHTNTHVPSIKL